MRKLSRFLFIMALLASVAGAQSGRRVPPPSTQAIPRDEIPVEAETKTQPPRVIARAELTAVPESVLGRELQTLRRERFRLADYNGKIVVINIWASWCGPCRQETPEMEEISREYAKRGVEFVGLTAEDPASAGGRVSAFVRDSKVSYRIGWIDRTTANALMNGRNVIPQTFVVRGDGRILRRFVGYNASRSGQMLREAIDRALDKDDESL
ncbi:MAG: TlpA disulfide reductase family protein [Pyrinomonadaceae bacterium]